MSNEYGEDDSGEGAAELPEGAPSFLERIPLALQVLMVAEIAGNVQDAQRLKSAPAVLEENAAEGTGEKMNQLVAAFTKDLEQLAQKWMKALGPIDMGDENAAKGQMSLIMISALTALGTRYHLVERILRQTYAKERLRAVDKQCQRAARAFLEGAANGQPGIRRVK